MEKVTIQFDADLSPLQDKLGQLKSSGLEQLSSGANEASSSIDKLSQSAKNMPMNVISQGFDEATTSIKENSQAITENVSKQQTMKAELRDLKNKLQELEDAGKANTAEFEAMAERAGHLTDQIGDTSNRIRVLGDDSKYIKAVSQAIGAMASAYSVAQGASALFGEKNKDLTQVLVKVNAAMAIANGIEQLRAATLKDSTLAVVLNSTATKAYSFVVGESTGALKIFRVALASTGIGLVVLAVGALVANWKEFVGWLNKSFPQLQAVTNFFANFRQVASGAIDAIVAGFKGLGKILGDIFTGDISGLIQDAKNFGANIATAYNEGYAEKDRELKIKKGLEDRKLQIDIAEAQGKNVNAIKLKYLQDELSILEKGSEDYNKKLIEIEGVRKAISDKAKADAKKQLERDNEQRLQELNDFYEKDVLMYQTMLTTMKEGSKEYQDTQNKLIEAQTAYAQYKLALANGSTAEYFAKLTLTNAEANKTISDNTEKTQDDLSKQTSEWIKKQMKLEGDKIQANKDGEKEFADFMQQVYDDNEKALADSILRKQEMEKANRQALKDQAIASIQTIANAEFEIDKANRDAKLDADIDRLESQKENELKNKDLTEAQKLAIQTKYGKLEAEAKKKAWEAEQDAKKKQAIINGALAITNIWATYGGTNPVLAGILTAASIISTATQVRVIDSQPVPKFAKGKNLDGYEGMAIIGEAGRELRLDSDGSMKMYNRATLDHVNADSIILPNNLTEALLKTNIPAMNLRNMNAVTKQNISAKLDIDYKKLARTLGEELKNSQKVSVNIDEKGFETRIMNGISERRVIDNRYKL
jgi:hypothetical protein